MVQALEETSSADGLVTPASFWLPEALLESAWLQHAPFAFWLIESLKPRQFVELGTHRGFSYLAFCQAAERIGLDARGSAIDTWQGDEHAGFYGDEVYARLRELHDPRYGGFSRLVRSTFDEALPLFAEKSIDLLHIDGRHFYDDVKHDFESWKGKLSDRAVVLFHDTNVRKNDFGVFRLWEELRPHFPAFEFLHGHGLGVLGVGPKVPEPLKQLFGAADAADRCTEIREIYARLGSAVEERHRLSKPDRAGGQGEDRQTAPGSASPRWLPRAMVGKVIQVPRDISRRWRRSWQKRFGFAEENAFAFTQLGNARYRKYLTSRLALRAEPVLPRGFVDRMRKRMEKNAYITNANYQDWIARHDTLSDVDRPLIRTQIDQFAVRPTFSVLMPVHNTPERFLLAAIDALRRQLYPDWELCIVDDASTAAHIRPVIEKAARQDGRIKPVFRSAKGGMAAASNDALAIASGNWLVLADPADVLAEHSLYRIAELLNREPGAAIIYSDEDQIDKKGQRSNPYFKPDFSYDLLLGQNLFGHQGAYRTDLARQVHGFREDFEGSQDWDFALRILDVTTTETIHHIPAVLYHARRIPSPFSDVKPSHVGDAACKAVNEHLLRTRQAATASSQGNAGIVRVRRDLPAIRPLVSIVIPTKDHCELLSKCVAGLLERTDYAPIEIVIVNNGSSQPDALELLHRLNSRPNIKVLDDPRPFNYSQLVNLGVASAEGEVCVLLNNDVDVINPDWLDELVSHAVRPGVGAVGAKLYYDNDTIQHAGMILGIGGISGHAHRHAPRSSGGYHKRLKLTHNLSCVTAACLAVRKSVYDEVGGFDEENLRVACNDVDFCLKLRQAGYSIVWTPYAELYHYESISRGSDSAPQNAPRAKAEIQYMRRRWADVLDQDPFHNPNLSLDRDVSCFEPATSPRMRKPWLK